MASAGSGGGGGEGGGHKVVIAMDGSQHSNNAFQWYIDNVHRSDNKVILVHCPEYRSLTNAPYLTCDPDKMSELARKEESNIKLLVARLREDIDKYGINGFTVRAAGKPGEAIIKLAQAENATMIVIGSRGLGTLRRTFMGSVSDYVTHHTTCPVIIVRQTDAVNE
ncbi:hypothetical protein FSP39_016783 [Pinctada imbricata]|uniref:UspA domain-containing protein n=1 Tax=Pinctada imbricata TaxID=66713 RepID=A0AA89CB12_PINIB|nr:hypothetical protein FSP39_016783 [Pinctada imbricata]